VVRRACRTRERSGSFPALLNIKLSIHACEVLFHCADSDGKALRDRLFVCPCAAERGNAAFRATQLGDRRPATRTGVPRRLGTGVGARPGRRGRCPFGRMYRANFRAGGLASLPTSGARGGLGPSSAPWRETRHRGGRNCPIKRDCPASTHGIRWPHRVRNSLRHRGHHGAGSDRSPPRSAHRLSHTRRSRRQRSASSTAELSTPCRSLRSSTGRNDSSHSVLMATR